MKIFLPTQIVFGLKFTLYPGERYFSRGNKRAHVYSWERHNNKKVPKGFHVHHKDENPWNNNPLNLELIQAGKHSSLHIKKRFADNPDLVKKFQQKGSEAAKEWHSSEEGKEWHSQHGKQSYKKRIAIEKSCEFCGKKYKTKHLGKSKYCHQNCKQKARTRNLRGKI